MDKAFILRLTEYLNSECDDYGMNYDYEWSEDEGCCNVTITTDRNDRSTCLKFRYNEEKDDLEIELSENSYYTTREFDESVKYFWMLVSPSLFPI